MNAQQTYRVSCPDCDKAYRSRHDPIRRRMRCPKCSSELVPVDCKIQSDQRDVRARIRILIWFAGGLAGIALFVGGLAWLVNLDDTNQNLSGGAIVKPPEPTRPPPPPPVPIDILARLRKSTKVSGYASFQKVRKFDNNQNQSYTAHEWNLWLEIENKTAYTVDLNNELVLVATDARESFLEGFLRIRGPSRFPPSFPPDPFRSAPYRLDYFDSTDGTKSFKYFGFKGYQNGKGVHPKGAGIGKIAAGEKREIKENFEMGPGGEFLKDEFRAAIRVALPEFIVAKKRFRTIVEFRNQGRPLFRPQNVLDSQLWRVAKTTISAVNEIDMSNLLKDDKASLVTKIFAADLKQDVAARHLIATAKKLTNGELLASCLNILIRMKAKGLEEHCVSLVEDRRYPNGIRGAAAKYLGATKNKPAFPVLIKALADSDRFVSGESAMSLCSFLNENKDIISKLLQYLRDADRPGMAHNNVAKALSLQPLENHGPEVIDILLTAKHNGVTRHMANWLIQKNWKGELKNYKPRFAAKLKLPGGHQTAYDLIRFLRYVSGQAMEPKSSSEYYRNPKMWRQTWADWCTAE